ncbi:hypothetical protein JCM10449v2_006031 [Rhodotorula kratochvilovae]
MAATLQQHSRRRRQVRPVKNDSIQRRADDRLFRRPPAAPAKVPLGQGAVLAEMAETPGDDAFEALRQGALNAISRYAFGSR